MVGHTFNPSSQTVTGEAEVSGHSQSYTKFKASLDHMGLCLKTKNKKQRQKPLTLHSYGEDRDRLRLSPQFGPKQ